ncbi:peroxiredoxin hyr1 [Tulasnella sp. 330]|nr:peroxiredoxin hyr1 [Tulasnella sp. 330]
MAEFYKLKSTTNSGQPFDFETLQGKVVLVVNTASKCGFTPQYTGLQELHAKYKDQGLVVLGFPCNQFGGQEPASDEQVAEFCQLNHGVDFQLMKKSDVNGDDANEVFKYLKSQQSSLGLTRIKWNFEKFLVDRHGKVVSRWSSMRAPTAMEADIQKLLEEKA